MADFTQVKTIHIIGVGGTAMGTFAALLRSKGYEVRGSDQNIYPPMSDKLREWGIPYVEGYAAANLDPLPDLVVVGNAIRKDNPEAARAQNEGLNQASFPETLGALFLDDKHSVVVAGTHGKTTTSTLIARTLVEAGRDPGFLIGGVPQDEGESFRLGQGEHFVVEGDEYDTVYWDKVPKFVHYRPRTAVLTSVEFDHADIYADFAAVRAAFAKLMALMPDDGTLVFAGAHQQVRSLAESAHCETIAYGKNQQLDAKNFAEDEQGLHFSVVMGGHDLGEVRVNLSGEHGLEDALAAYAVCHRLGLSHDEIANGFKAFAGVRRRMELRGEVDGIKLIDDFAHHPTAVRLTLEGARARFSGRRIWALFEPRSATASRKVFQQDFAKSFAAADQVIIATSGRKGQYAAEMSIDEAQLAQQISSAGVPARYIDSIDEIVKVVAAEAQSGDVVIVMSNGGFGGVHDKILQQLKRPGEKN